MPINHHIEEQHDQKGCDCLKAEEVSIIWFVFGLLLGAGYIILTK